jgi:3-oxoacyl-[acyl-carrier-protein] synthase-1
MTYLTSAGMVCAVGLRAEAACAAIRAGIAGFQETKHRDQTQRRVVGAPLPGLPADMRGADRLVAMLSMSVADCLKAQVVEDSTQIPLLVGLAEPGRPGVAADTADAVLHGVQEKLRVRFHPGLSRALSGGHTSGFEALGVARTYLQTTDVPACLVSGVDSYLNSETLAWLGAHDRLKTLQNSDGVIPGEAAATVLVCREPGPNPATAAEVLGLGFARESASILTEEPMLGLGLADAARKALAEAQIEMHEVDFRLSDVTGESYGFREQVLLVGRLLKTRREKLPLWDCAGTIGDIGAAAGVCQLVVAYYAFRKRYAAGERALCCTSAVPGERAVALIHGGLS